MVVLIDGLLAAHVTRGGKTMTTFFDTFPDGIEDPMPLVVDALASVVQAGRMQPISVEKLNGESAFSLKDYGVTVTHKGVRIGAKVSAPPKRRGRSMSEALEELGPPDGLSFDD